MSTAEDGFRSLDEKSLLEYIKATPSLLAKLGGAVDNLIIKEVGDGNLNFVYIVVAPSGSLVVKQVPLTSQFLAAIQFDLRRMSSCDI